MHARKARTAVSRPDDAREREAERLAERMAARNPSPSVQPLPFYEEALGHDFSRVRIHDDANAHALAQSYEARAFTYGNDVYFGRGELAGPDASRLMAHELAHTVQPDAATTVMRQAAPSRATRATLEQRQALMPIFNPEGGGGAAGPLTDPAGFRTEMMARMNEVIDRMLGDARLREASPLELSRADLQPLSTVAWREITARYGPYLSRAVTAMTPAAVQADLTERVHLVSDMENPEFVACNLLVMLMNRDGGEIMDRHNVVANSDAAKGHCDRSSTPAATAVLPADQRDQVLFESVRDAIITARHDDLLFAARWGPSYSDGDQAWIQTRLVAREGESEEQTLRRWRWRVLGTLIHELLHTATHPSFRSAFGALQRTDIGIEGFAEYFAREVYNGLRERAESDETLRMSIETLGSSFDSSLAPDRTAYEVYMPVVNDIRRILQNNDENLREAYFAGRMEYLGLGNWGLPPNVVGVGIYLANENAFLRAHYARVVLGHTGRLQLHAGGDLTYFGQGDRLGIGPDLTLQYSWPNLFVSAGVGAQITTGAREPIGQSIRLDVLPHVDAGVRFNMFRVGVGAAMLIPTAGAPGTDRTRQFMLGVGGSVEW